MKFESSFSVKIVEDSFRDVYWTILVTLFQVHIRPVVRNTRAVAYAYVKLPLVVNG